MRKPRLARAAHAPRHRKPARPPARRPRPTARFSVVHADESAYKGDGLRPDFVYRDLGIKRATGKRVGAHIIRAARPCAGPIAAHRHALDVQLVYVLKGRVKFWYEGHGEVEMTVGACVHQPPGINHIVVDWSDDLELLEVTLPADFATKPA